MQKSIQLLLAVDEIDLLLCEGSMCLKLIFVEVTASLFNWNSQFTWYIPQEFLQLRVIWLPLSSLHISKIIAGVPS